MPTCCGSFRFLSLLHSKFLLWLLPRCPAVRTAAVNKTSCASALRGHSYKRSCPGLPCQILRALPVPQHTRPPLLYTEKSWQSLALLHTPEQRAASRELCSPNPVLPEPTRGSELPRLCGNTWLKAGISLRRIKAGGSALDNTKYPKLKDVDQKLSVGGRCQLGWPTLHPVRLARPDTSCDPTPLISRPAELGFAGELLSWQSTTGALPLPLVEPGFHNASYSIHGEITLGIHTAEIPAVALTSWKRMGLVRAY